MYSSSNLGVVLIALALAWAEVVKTTGFLVLILSSIVNAPLLFFSTTSDFSLTHVIDSGISILPEKSSQKEIALMAIPVKNCSFN